MLGKLFGLALIASVTTATHLRQMVVDDAVADVIGNSFSGVTDIDAKLNGVWDLGDSDDNEVLDLKEGIEVLKNLWGQYCAA